MPIAYAQIDPVTVDHTHLRILSILHYVWGGIMMLLSCLFIFHIVMGIVVMSGALVPPPTSQPGNEPPMELFGLLFVVMGSAALLIGWTFGILTIFSGRFIAGRRRRTFSLVIAGINCASFPLGTALGVFTFIVLLRSSVAAAYGLRPGA